MNIMRPALATLFWIFLLGIIEGIQTKADLFGQSTDSGRLLVDSREKSTSAPNSSLFQVLEKGDLFIVPNARCLRTVLVEVLISNSTTKTLKLKMSWNSTSPVTHIMVKTNSEWDDYCDASNKFFYESSFPQNESYSFPDVAHSEGRFIPFKPDCNYSITLTVGDCRVLGCNDTNCEEQFFNDKEYDERNFSYVIPSCVKNELGKKVCSCRKALTLPSPIVRLENRQEGVTVHWEIPPNSSDETIARIRKIVITVEPKESIATPYTPLYKELTLKNWTMLNRKDKQYFPINAKHGKEHIVRIFFVDDLDCDGPETIGYFHSSAHRPTGKEFFWMLLVFFLILLLVIIVLHFIWKKCQRSVICLKIWHINSQPENSRQTNQLVDLGLSSSRVATNPLYTSDPTEDANLIDYKILTFIRKIDEGNFGVVYEAIASRAIQNHTKVAVKQLKRSSGSEQITDFVQEMTIFKKTGHHENIVKMLGYCKSPQPLCIVMEYVCGGNLRQYLIGLRNKFEKRKLELNGSVGYVELVHSSGNRDSDDDYISQSEIESPLLNQTEGFNYILESKELESFGLQIAQGMEHLELKNIIHRDLAARNILMDYGKRLKISDFGMSRTGVYVNRRGGKFPLRWMPLEAITYRTYSNKSDVWSFGVVLWEIGTLGALPYTLLSDDEVILHLKQGKHLNKPENVTEDLYNLMVSCWALTPDQRPAFSEIADEMHGLCQKRHAYVDFSALQSGYTFPPTEDDIKKNKK